MQLTDIAAIIGCLTGPITLIILIRNELKNRPKIEISLIDPSCFFFKNNPHPEFESNYQSIISLRILNKSPLPITIYDLKVRTAYKELSITSYSRDSLKLKLNFLSGESLPLLLVTPNSKFNLPVTIKPFDIHQTHLFVPSFANETSREESIEIEVITTAKTFRDKFQLKLFAGVLDLPSK